MFYGVNLWVILAIFGLTKSAPQALFLKKSRVLEGKSKKSRKVDEIDYRLI